MLIYTIHKGLNQELEFKGLKAQYISYAGGLTLVLLGIYALLYLMGFSPLLAVFITLAAGICALLYLVRLSGKYGQTGLQKHLAGKRVPEVIRMSGREVFAVPGAENKHPSERRPYAGS